MQSARETRFQQAGQRRPCCSCDKAESKRLRRMCSQEECGEGRFKQREIHMQGAAAREGLNIWRALETASLWYLCCSHFLSLAHIHFFNVQCSRVYVCASFQPEFRFGFSGKMPTGQLQKSPLNIDHKPVEMNGTGRRRRQILMILKYFQGSHTERAIRQSQCWCSSKKQPDLFSAFKICVL